MAMGFLGDAAGRFDRFKTFASMVKGVLCGLGILEAIWVQKIGYTHYTFSFLLCSLYL
jgi:hypothetical protein